MQMNLPATLFLIPLLELLGVAAFAYVGGTSFSGGRYLVLLAVAAFVIWVAATKGKELGARQIVIASLALSALFVVGFQLLGFIFRGLAKDMDVMSAANLNRLGMIGLLGVVGHIVLFLMVSRGKRKRGDANNLSASRNRMRTLESNH
jgi:hypothetical protein